MTTPFRIMLAFLRTTCTWPCAARAAAPAITHVHYARSFVAATSSSSYDWSPQVGASTAPARVGCWAMPVVGPLRCRITMVAGQSSGPPEGSKVAALMQRVDGVKWRIFGSIPDHAGATGTKRLRRKLSGQSISSWYDRARALYLLCVVCGCACFA